MLAPLLVALAAVAAYLPVVVVPYAFEDDYWVLGAVHGLGGANVWSAGVSGGRPIQGALLTGIFAAVPDIDALRVVRVLGLVGTVLLGFLLYHAVRRSGVNRWVAASVAITVVTLPAFQVYVSWAVIFEAPYAALLAGLAWLRVPATFAWRSRTSLLRSAEAAVLLLAALFTYQPAAMFFWVFAAIEVLRPTQPLAEAARRLAAGLVPAFVALFGAFVWVKSVHFYYGTGNARSSLNTDFGGKLDWFWHQPLPNAANLFELVPRWSLAAAIALVAAAGITLLHAPKGRAAIGFVAIAAALVPLAYLPNLLLSENWASYRSLGALSSLFMVYNWLGLWGIVRAALRSARAMRRRLVLAVPIAAVLSFLALALVGIPLSHLPDPPGVHPASLDALVTWPRVLPFAGLAALFAALSLAPARLVRIGAACAVAALAATGVLLAARNTTTLFARTQSLEVRMLRSALDRPRVSAERRIVFVKPDSNAGAAPLHRYDEFGLPSSFAPWVPHPAVLLILRERGRTRRPPIDVLAWDQVPPHPSAAPNTVVVDMRRLRRHRVDWSLWTLRAQHD